MSKSAGLATKESESVVARPSAPGVARPSTPGAAASLSVTASAQFSTSPLPAPDMLAGYASISPDFPTRFMQLVEDEAKHRRDAEMKTLDAQLSRASTGQAIGFLVALAGLATAVALGYQGHPTSAAVIGSIDLVALVGIFVQQQKPRK